MAAGSVAEQIDRFREAVRPNRFQFGLNLVLTVMIAIVVSITKFCQGVMTGIDEDHDGEADNGGEFVVNSALQSTLFLVTFGLSKALANLFVGMLSDAFGCKWVMVTGWSAGLSVPIMVIAAKNWLTVAFSDVFLGIQQGMCWTLTIVMMIKLVGHEHPGFAVGLNETLGYTTIAVFNVVAAALVGADDDFRGRPFYFVFVVMVLGLVLSIAFLQDPPAATKPHGLASSTASSSEGHRVLASKEGATAEGGDEDGNGADVVVDGGAPDSPGRPNCVERHLAPWLGPQGQRSLRVFMHTSCENRNLMLCCQAGMMVNFMTAFAWGILTHWVGDYGGKHWDALSTGETAKVVLAYSIPKGVVQVFAGFASDQVGQRWPIAAGLWTCSIALCFLAAAAGTARSDSNALGGFIFGAFVLGLGTAMMYSAVAAAVSKQADDSWKATCVGCYRFWRDLGYAVGGLILGATTDEASTTVSTLFGAFLTALSGLAFFALFRDDAEQPLFKSRADKQLMELGTSEDGFDLPTRAPSAQVVVTAEPMVVAAGPAVAPPPRNGTGGVMSPFMAADNEL